MLGKTKLNWYLEREREEVMRQNMHVPKFFRELFRVNIWGDFIQPSNFVVKHTMFQKVKQLI